MKEYSEEDFLMLSGIQHYRFCKRQWALIHIEQQWAENVRTVEGKLMHEKAHDSSLMEKRGNLIISRAMPIHSRFLGASGECDIVEFKRDKSGINIHGKEGNFKIFPVEYKKGSPKKADEDIYQLVAQAICLEEMFCCNIDKGYLYYGETKRRLPVEITNDLKAEVKVAFEEMHQLYERRYTPKVKRSKSCNACSIKDLCLPVLCKEKSVRKSLINKKMNSEKGFIKKENGAVIMEDETRKQFLTAWQNKKQETIKHPFLGEKIEWGMLPYVQALLLARYIRGDLDEYPPFMWK